jgi:Family of unknown function (DUF5309)
MPATLQTVSAITKELYEGTLNKQLEDETLALKRIERTSDGVSTDVGGKYVVFPIHTRRNAGLGARNEMEALPTPGQQSVAAGRIGLKYEYGAIRLSGQTMELAKTNAQAFVSALDLEMNGLKSDVRKDQNRQFYSDGTGLVARISAIGTGVSTVAVSYTNWLQLGMQVDVITGTTINNPTPTVVASNRQVTAIDTAAKTVTLSGATITVAVGDLIVRTGSVNREWTGIGSIIRNTGVLYNIDPTVEPVWKSEVNTNAGTLRALSEGLMTEMIDRIRANGGQTTVVFQSLGVRRAYANLLTQQRRYVNTQSFTGGFSGLAFTTDNGDIPIVADVDCPPNTQYFINEKEIKLYREGEWSFMDRDGSMWQRVTGFDAYEATYFQYSEIGSHRRNTHGVIQDVTEG